MKGVAGQAWFTDFVSALRRPTLEPELVLDTASNLV
jgi:hypothetical protein